MNHAKWIAYFNRNRLDRPEPDWSAPVSIPARMYRPLLKSLEQFRLGDGGGPASLIARNAEHFRGRSEQMRTIVDLWFAEEAEHARLLGCAVKRLGGRYITSHWSFTAFCVCRRVIGVDFELQVLLLTELVSTAYYRTIRAHSPDIAVTQMCDLILRDEAGHVAFHRERLADEGRSSLGLKGALWQAQFWTFGHAAATMLWVNHGPAMSAIGSSRSEYFREVRRQLGRFIVSLDRLSDSIQEKPVAGLAGHPHGQTAAMPGAESI
ncbi:MAG TPA: ferritin-like domain-containing protein [Verrucomicrobiae bacterium]|nr:ferritin-like domain-containing protein [Verrucomicrobiae bacterium]